MWVDDAGIRLAHLLRFTMQLLRCGDCNEPNILRAQGAQTKRINLMLALTAQDIYLQQSAASKEEAIKAMATRLIDKGLVAPGYQAGMLAREAQTSTYLGNGIAIPHGTTDTRDQVKQTGVQMCHFPQGVDWGDGETAYLAIGIAAKSDEHLTILRQLTHVLSQDGIEAQLKRIESADAILALLNGGTKDNNQGFTFTPDMILSGFPARDITTLQAAGAGLLKNSGCLDTSGVSHLIAATPVHLGEGHWVLGIANGVSHTGVSLVMPSEPLNMGEHVAHALWCFAAKNDAHMALLAKLTQLKAEGKLNSLINQSPDALVSAVMHPDAADVETVQPPAPAAKIEGESGLFTITNAHGLHARPGAMLVNTAKKFSADIQVANASTQSAAVNAKSLMKVIALGVKHGHQLQFTAQGSDAQEAIAALGEAIRQGLGEHA